MADFEDALAWWLLGGSGEDSGILRAVIDDDASSLIIVAGNGAEDEAHGVFNYTYETLEISDEIKMQITSGGVVTTNTKKFSAKLISKLYNYDGELIFRAECSSKGKINGFYDGSGKELHAKRFELNRGENIGISGADAPAIAWCMAKNSERSSSFMSQKKSYREGLADSEADVTEDYSEEGSQPIIVDDDKVTEPGVTDMLSGVYYDFENAYVRVFKDGKPGEDSLPVDLKGSGAVCDVYNSGYLMSRYYCDYVILHKGPSLGYWNLEGLTKQERYRPNGELYETEYYKKDEHNYYSASWPDSLCQVFGDVRYPVGKRSSENDEYRSVSVFSLAQAPEENSFRYKYTSKLCYDVYDHEGNLLGSEKLGDWYYQSWDIRKPDLYSYAWVSGVKIIGDSIYTTRTVLNEYGEKSFDCRLSPIKFLPEGAKVVSTGSSMPF